MGKAGQRPQDNALVSCSLSMALPALLLLQRANMSVASLCTFNHWKVSYFEGLLHIEPLTAAVADVVHFYSLNE